MLGTAGLPHILMRFFTVPDAKAARSSVIWAMVLIGAFYLMTTALGFGARAILGKSAREAVGETRQLRRADARTGARRTTCSLLAIVAGVAFATILAVVAGLVISASGAVAHDVWSNIVRRGQDSEREEVWVAKIAAFSIGAIAIAIAIIGGEGLNVSFMVGLAFAVAASANFPALLLALTWKRFNTTGAVTGVLFGVISSVALVVISQTVWPGPDSEGGALSWYTLANPGIIIDPARASSAAGWAPCWPESRRRSASSTSCRCAPRPASGAEVATGLKLTAAAARRRTAAAATTTMSSPLCSPSAYNLAQGNYERERNGRVHQGLRGPDRAASSAELLDQETFEPPAEFRRARR